MISLAIEYVFFHISLKKSVLTEMRHLAEQPATDGIRAIVAQQTQERVERIVYIEGIVRHVQSLNLRFHTLQRGIIHITAMRLQESTQEVDALPHIANDRLTRAHRQPQLVRQKVCNGTL